MPEQNKKLTRHQRGFIVTVTYNRGGEIYEETYRLEEIEWEFTESFSHRLLEADGEEVPYNSNRPEKPVCGRITGHVDDYDEYEVEAENELDEIWNGGGSMKLTEEDWGW